jgi:Tfp pilus assembly protein PilF
LGHHNTHAQRLGIPIITLFLLLASALATGCVTEAQQRKKAEKEAQYHYDLGASYFGEQFIPQALRELLLSIEAEPNNPEALHLLGFIYMGRKDYPSAIKHFRQAVEQDPEFYICWNNLGTAYLASARWEEAVDLYQDLISKPMYNTPELAYNNLGWAYFNLGMMEQAREQFEMAAFLKPEMCLAHNNLGLVRTKQGNYVGASRSFETAIKGCPDYAEPNFHLAQILQANQNTDARYYYERCYTLASESRWGERCRSYLEVVP